MTEPTNYPSCIKIPSSKPNLTGTVPRFDMKEALAINNELILLANREFGAGKWSHSITNQTLDFVESFMGKYVCGCATFVKIELKDGAFHEDMGYCYAEGTTKGLSIHNARVGSLSEAFRKVLLCFGGSMEAEIAKIIRKCQKSVQRQDLHSTIASIQSEAPPEPCAQSTPYIGHKATELKPEVQLRSNSPIPQKLPVQGTSKVKLAYDEEDLFVEVAKVSSKSPVNQIPQIIPQSSRARSKSPINKVQPAQLLTSPRPAAKDTNSTNCQSAVEYNGTNSNLVDLNTDAAKGLSEEEIQRMERKRKQMEKQAEYKRLMKEKMMQKPNDNKKPNPKY